MKYSLYRFATSSIATLAVVGTATPRSVQAEEPFAIVRAGDRAMPCDALAAEINTLSQPATTAVADKPKKHGGLGFLKVLGAAAPFVPGIGGVGGGVVSSLAMTAGTATAQNQVGDQMADARRMAQDAVNGGTPQQQRKERLTALFDERKC